MPLTCTRLIQGTWCAAMFKVLHHIAPRALRGWHCAPMAKAALFLVAVILTTAAAHAQPYEESTFWRQEVDAGDLPPVADRLPRDALVVDLEAKGRAFGTQGGTLRTLVSRSKDVRQMVVYGYARLMGYDQNYVLYPDILRDIEVTEGRIFTMYLRDGHKWSDGSPFTSDDFRYWWENVVLNKKITPSGPPEFMYVDDTLGTVTFPDKLTVRFEWPTANPNFLPLLAQAAPPFVYRP